tara:strand:+ start:24761 stop:27178 length:2418 start_codon:yes stop_codon:yes gene_type:complete
MKLLRKLNANWQWLSINILGLALAFACVTMVFSYTVNELSYDQFHSKSDRIYRATISTQGSSLQHPARVWGEWVPQLVFDYPAIENLVRMVPFKKGIVQIGEERFYSDNLFRVDSSFFQIYDFKLLSGDRTNVLNKPAQVVISQSMAQKYFGRLDVLGEQIEITHQQVNNAQSYTIVGVMEDFPANSHFHADALTTIPDMQFNNSWGYTYYLLKEGTNVEELRQAIQTKLNTDLEANDLEKTLHFQKLSDIHLYSHKTREIETNGDFRSIILLASGAIMILIIALINFLNLSRVQFIASIKSIKIKMIHGATKKQLANEIMLESLIVSGAAIGLGLILSYKLGVYLQVDSLSSLGSILFFSILFILSIALLAAYPLLSSNIVSDAQVKSSRSALYTFPLVMQFTLAVIAIAGAIVLQRQMNFITEQHPQAKNENIVVIERNPWAVVQRFEQLKNELISDPSIENITGAMEEPGGDVLDNFFFEMEGVDPLENQTIYILTTDSNFFTAMGIEALAGSVDLGYTPNQQWESNATELSSMIQQENFDQVKAEELLTSLGDYREKYILNESALKMLGINNPQDAIGKGFHLRFHLPYVFPEGEVVAVVPDFHYTNLHHAERPMVMVARQMFSHNFLIQIDSNRRGEALAAISKSWKKVNPDFPLEYSFITDSYAKVYATEYAQSKVLSLFALISVVLSALGTYAIAAFSMQRRVKEIGIRKVNGASTAEIMTMLNRKFLIWVSLAFVIATPIAWYAMRRWLENFAYQTDLSWWIFALAGLIALCIALLTVSIQSYLVATRNPVESLRYE